MFLAGCCTYLKLKDNQLLLIVRVCIIVSVCLALHNILGNDHVQHGEDKNAARVCYLGSRDPKF